MPAAAIIFDLDGTLVDSAPDIAWGINRMLADHGLGPLAVRDVERLTGEGACVLVARVLERLGVPADHARVAQDTAAYLAHYRTRPCIDTTLYDGVAETLAALNQAGIKLAVCTNKPEALAVLVLHRLHLLDLMQAVVGADTTPARKPDPLPLLHTLGLLGVGPAESLFVGDTAIDRDCAHAAGVRCRLVAWGVAACGTPPSERLARFADLLPA